MVDSSLKAKGTVVEVAQGLELHVGQQIKSFSLKLWGRNLFRGTKITK